MLSEVRKERKLSQEKGGGLEEQGQRRKLKGTPGLGPAAYKRGFLHHEADNEVQEVPMRGDPAWPL